VTQRCLHESDSRPGKLFTISEVPADWHELMKRIMLPSIACASEQLEKQCSQQTCHRNTRKLCYR